MGSDTIYSIKVKYDVDGAPAKKGIEGISLAADKAKDSAFSLKGALAGLGVFEALHKGKEYLIDFNSEMQKLQIGMETVMEMNLHLPFQKAHEEAQKLFLTFQNMAKKSPVTTKDFMDMAAAIAPAVSGAGGGPEKLAALTKGAITAGLAYGKDSQTTAMAISEMMMGNARKTNPLAMSLIASTGMDHNAFNQMDPVKRAELVEKILTDPALNKAAERFGETLTGQTSTLKDNIQIALGEVGLPLMEAITAEVKKVNQYITDNESSIKRFGQEFSSALVTGFSYVKSTVGFIVSHSDLFLTLGKIWAVSKVGGMLGGIGGGMAGAGQGEIAQLITGPLGDKIGNSVRAGVLSLGMRFPQLINPMASASKLLGGLGGAAGALGPAGIAGIGMAAYEISKMTGVTQALTQAIDPQRAELEQLTEQMYKFDDAVASAAAKLNGTYGKYSSYAGGANNVAEGYRQKAEVLHDMAKGGISKTDQFQALSSAGFNRDEAINYMKKSSLGLGVASYEFRAKQTDITTRDALATKEATELVKMQKDALPKGAKEKLTPENLADAMGKAYAYYLGTSGKAALPGMAPNLFDVNTQGWGGGGKPEINVTIQKVEVASEDPDRFVFGLVKVAEQSTKHKTQSAHTTPGGF